MPMAHAMYEQIRELLPEPFLTLFPEWTRGPFGVALHIGGYNNVLLSMLEDPEYFHGLMGRIVEERKNYFRFRADLTGEPGIPPASLFNDEIDAGIIGPHHYREFIRPHEEELARFHGRISYWHSCGNTGILAAEVLNLGRIDVLDISGYTDFGQVLARIDPTAARLDIRLHPLRDLQDASPERMEARVAAVIRACREHGVQSMSIRVSGMNPWKTPEDDFARIRLWIELARRAIART